MENHKIVSREEWLVARKKHLAEEKEFTRLRDRLSRQRRDLPWMKVDKDYVFNGPDGKETLSGLFEGRHQLLVYHFIIDSLIAATSYTHNLTLANKNENDFTPSNIPIINPWKL